MNKKLILILSIYLILISAIGLIIISNNSSIDTTTEKKSEFKNNILLSAGRSKIQGTVFQERGGIIKALMLK
jgi:hypothetical protein